ncbi:alpha-mannosidase, partial [Candidatus Calescamantes bacterium]|nr:alpha-mannosidase [Candidatus Calescamantes bacterium]
IHLIGHAHIDMNWLWTYEDTKITCLRDFSTVLNLMEEYPDLTFSQSQAHIYRIVEEENPKLLEKVREKVRKGRWDVTASAWVEGDLNMAEGESIVRHILYTRKYTQEKFGRVSKIMWSPDTFGHPITIPTILKNADIRYYYFMRCGKGLPLFRWKGKDGSEILAFNSVYNNRIDSDTILPLFIDFYQRYRIGEMMFVYGVGDHGGGPTRMDIERKKNLDEKPLIPRLEFSTTEKFFAQIEKFTSQLPVVEDELNTIFEGCYTTHSDIKKANRECEMSLLVLEAIGSIASLQGFNYPGKEIEDMWQITLFNQFHDILDGSAIHASYDYSNQIAQSVMGNFKNLLKKATKSLVGKEGEESIFVFNPCGWSRDGLVEFEIPKHLKRKEIHLEGIGGKKISVEVKDSRGIFKAEEIPGYGYKSFLLRKGKIEYEKKLHGRGKGLWENPFYTIEIDENTGLIRRIYDKKNKREVITPCKSIQEDPGSWWAETGGNLVKVLWEKPHPMSAWIIGNIYRVENLIDAENIRIEENSMNTMVNVSRRYRDSRLTQRTIIYSDFPYIDFELEVDWKEAGNKEAGVPMVRVNFHFNMESAKPFFEVPFGAFSRRNEPREYPTLKWAALKEDDYWVGILNREKYGYYVDGSNLSLTVLRNAYEPDSLSDTGYQKISYRLYFGKIDELDLSRKAQEFNMGMIVERGRSRQPEEFSLFKVRGEVMVTCFKKALNEDAYILRISEVKGKRENCRIDFYRLPRSIYITNLLEQEGKELEIKDSSVEIEIPPYSLMTLKLCFA